VWGSIGVSTILKGFLPAGIVAFAAIGLGNLAAWLLGDRRFDWNSGRRILWGVAAALATYGLYSMGRSLEIPFEHALYTSPIGQIYVKVLFVLAAAGWAIERPKFNGTILTGALGCALIASLRNPIWEYYLVDTALLALLASFCQHPQETVSELKSRGSSLRRLVAAPIIAFALLWFHFWFAQEAKHGFDRDYAVVQLFEEALRAHRIAPDEISAAPFGYIGWHLYPHFIHHEGAGGVYIANFIDYLKNESLAIDVRADDDMRPLQDPDKVVTQGIFRVGYLRRHRFILWRQEGKPAQQHLDLAQYKFQPFPLNEAEWERMLDETRSSIRTRR
jgi:hypothetical protein